MSVLNRILDNINFTGNYSITNLKVNSKCYLCNELL